MKKEFVPYEQSLELKKMGFDGDCFAIWSGFDEINFSTTDKVRLYSSEFRINDTQSATFYTNDFNSLSHRVSAPTFTQIFRWFREKYGLIGYIQTSYVTHEVVNNRNIPCTPRIEFTFGITNTIGKSIFSSFKQGSFKTYEEAEHECLKKLIEIIKNGKK